MKKLKEKSGVCNGGPWVFCKIDSKTQAIGDFLYYSGKVST